VDFGDILKKWEKQGARAPYGKEGIEKKDDVSASLKGERRSRLLRKKPEDSVDLHGLTRDEAWTALQTFFDNSRSMGYEKLLIIHGKGNHRTRLPGDAPLSEGHSLGEGALRELSRRFIETCPFAGESGHGSAREGGTGATWVILKEKN